MSEQPDNLFRHYKGGLYRFLREATCETTQQPAIVYMSEADGRVWVRPASEFYGSVHEYGPGGVSRAIRRFQKVTA